MERCAELFAGEHDFTMFCRPEGKSATLTVDSVDVYEKDGLAVLDFSARYFLWNMIRRIVAAIASVGRGDSALSDVKDALDGKDITFGLARADGLTLLDVCYRELEFAAPPADMFDKRIAEEMFKDRLRGMFFASL
jgi:tRNA pseudouridine38-40 synthase